MVLAYYPQRMKRSLTTNSNYPPQGFVPAAGISGGAMAYEDLEIMGYEPEWLDLAWQERIPLTINAGQIPSPLTGFKFLIDSTFPDLIGEVEAELRFAGPDNIQLEYEIQNFDNGTGALIAWVLVPNIDVGDIINVYFDNPAAVDEQNAPAVWSDYQAVYHMNNFNDSLGNNNLTNNGSTDVAGQIGRARSFDGNNDFMTSNAILPGDVGWVSLWVFPRDRTTDQYILNIAPNKYAIIIGFQNFQFNFFTYPTGTPADSQFTPTEDVWQKIDVVTFGSTTKIYKNGSIVRDLTDIQNRAGTTDTVIGSPQGTSNFNDGNIDEIEFTDVIPSNIDDRITAMYNNQVAPNTFYSTGTVETPPPSTIAMGYEI